MTYGIFDKEELKFEKQLEALLTEAPPKRKPGHWSDIYARAGWDDDTPNTPVTPEKPKDDTESVPQDQKLNNFDIDNLIKHGIVELLTNPTDHRGDNYRVIIEHDENGELLPFKIVAIDNDNEPELTEDRVDSWCKTISEDFK